MRETEALRIRAHSQSPIFFKFQDRVGHGIASATAGFPGAPRTPVSDFQPPYFPPPFHTAASQQTAQEVFAAQAPHLVSDPYNVTNSLHNFQSSQVPTLTCSKAWVMDIQGRV